MFSLVENIGFIVCLHKNKKRIKHLGIVLVYLYLCNLIIHGKK